MAWEHLQRIIKPSMDGCCIVLLYVGLGWLVRRISVGGVRYTQHHATTGIFHLREETGGEPEQRDPVLAVGDSPDSTTASPFLTCGLISDITDILTDTDQSFPVEGKAPQTMGPWLRGGESTAQTQPPLLAAGGEVGGQLVKIGRQVELRSYDGIDL